MLKVIQYIAAMLILGSQVSYASEEENKDPNKEPYWSIEPSIGGSFGGIQLTLGVSQTTSKYWQYGGYISVHNGEQEADDDDDSSSSSLTPKEFMKMRGQGLSTYFRFFPSGEKFYIKPSIDYASFEGSYGYKNDLSSVSTDYKASGVRLSFAVGTQWKYDEGYHIGCDWVGYSHMNSDISIDDSDTVGAVKSDYKSRAKELFDNGATYSVLNLHIGWKIK